VKGVPCPSLGNLTNHPIISPAGLAGESFGNVVIIHTRPHATKLDAKAREKNVRWIFAGCPGVAVVWRFCSPTRSPKVRKAKLARRRKKAYQDEGDERRRQNPREGKVLLGEPAAGMDLAGLFKPLAARELPMTHVHGPDQRGPAAHGAPRLGARRPSGDRFLFRPLSPPAWLQAGGWGEKEAWRSSFFFGAFAGAASACGT
jgi:hypothetical protein